MFIAKSNISSYTFLPYTASQPTRTTTLDDYGLQINFKLLRNGCSQNPVSFL